MSGIARGDRCAHPCRHFSGHPGSDVAAGELYWLREFACSRPGIEGGLAHADGRDDLGQAHEVIRQRRLCLSRNGFLEIRKARCTGAQRALDG